MILKNILNKTNNFIDKQIEYDYTIAIADALDWVTNKNKQTLQEHIQNKLNKLRIAFESDKGWTDRPNTLIEPTDSNFLWIPKYQINDLQSEGSSHIKNMYTYESEEYYQDEFLAGIPQTNKFDNNNQL